MSEPVDRDPVVTGRGVCCPLGRSPADLESALLSGRSAVGRVQSFDATGFASWIGAEVPAEWIPPVRDADGGPLAGRAESLGLAAAAAALRDAGWSSSTGPIDLIIGTTMGESSWVDSWPAGHGSPPLSDAAARELMMSAPEHLVERLSGQLAVPINRSSAAAGACAAGNVALGLARERIRAGAATAVLAGGVDGFSRTAFIGFSRLGALAQEQCRPFSRDRDGLVLGEGAAFLVVEDAESARRRGASVLARLTGSGWSCDAYHPTSPHPGGRGAAAALGAALRDARRTPDEVDWICAHGTGTEANDRAEVSAMRAVFARVGNPPPMSSIKALTGHGLGAASAIEAVACIAALGSGVVPPTWNHREPDPDCDWDVLPNRPARLEPQVVVNQAYAFGGCNAVIVLERPAS
jgi:3-oxoacyl-[acyl-carrier-protein] synthase II